VPDEEGMLHVEKWLLPTECGLTPR
jgi:hypothetical protein